MQNSMLKNLQTALSMELSAILQYQLHAHVAEDWGLNRLAEQMREEMQEEQGHADAYIRRIMYLGGDPTLEPAKVPSRAKNLEAMFRADLADENDAIAYYTESAQASAQAGDLGTRHLFEKTMLDEEEHKNWLETQLALIERLGEQTYALSMLRSDGEDAD